MPVVQTENLKKVYRDGTVAVNALNGVDIWIEKGEFTAIAGPSGSGKTTLLNLIGGLDTPSEGDVLLEGRNITKMGKGELSKLRLRSLGFIFQSYNLIPVLTARENVEFVMLLQGEERRTRLAKAKAILKEVGLGDLLHRRPDELSGGQQQRVAVARAIVSEPKIVLADEPTANLDSKTGEELMELMQDLNEKRAMTFLFSTHDRMVMDRARRLILLKDGKVVS